MPVGIRTFAMSGSISPIPDAVGISLFHNNQEACLYDPLLAAVFTMVNLQGWKVSAGW